MGGAGNFWKGGKHLGGLVQQNHGINSEKLIFFRNLFWTLLKLKHAIRNTQ
jgi:hypothetical protein